MKHEVAIIDYHMKPDISYSYTMGTRGISEQNARVLRAQPEG